MNIAKKLAVGLLAVLMLTSGLAACGADDDFNPESEFDNESLPVSFNLFDEGRMTPAGSQGGTGLCWAFGTLSTVESAILTATAGRAAVRPSRANTSPTLSYRQVCNTRRNFA